MHDQLHYFINVTIWINIGVLILNLWTNHKCSKRKRQMEQLLCKMVTMIKANPPCRRGDFPEGVGSPEPEPELNEEEKTNYDGMQKV